MDARTDRRIRVFQFLADAELSRASGRRSDSDGSAIDTLAIDPAVESRQVERVRALRAGRSAAAAQAALSGVTQAARDGANLVPAIITAVDAQATVGEIADAMRAVFGEFEETASL